MSLNLCFIYFLVCCSSLRHYNIGYHWEARLCVFLPNIVFLQYIVCLFCFYIFLIEHNLYNHKLFACLGLILTSF